MIGDVSNVYDMGKEKKGIWMWAPVVILRYGMAQGIHYMNWIEKIHRVCVEALFFLMVLKIVNLVPLSTGWRLGIALIGAHALNMILNGHIWALIKHDLYWFGFYKEWESFAEYVEQMQTRLMKRPCIGMATAEIYGSLTCGKFSDSSDLDIRFVAKPGFWNGILTCNRVVEERFRAFISAFPLDVYMFRNHDETMRKMKTALEKPIFIYKASDDTLGLFRDSVLKNQREMSV